LRERFNGVFNAESTSNNPERTRDIGEPEHERNKYVDMIGMIREREETYSHRG
jgi:hypothetical protein